MRIRMIREDLTTIEKSMKSIEELSGEETVNYNQLVRWINNKELHASKVQEVVTQYFMTQRIKHPGDGDAKALATYHKRLALLHQILVYAMKCKQTTDLENVRKARELVTEFASAYFSAEDLMHLQSEHGGGK
jgi:nickel superoxide dismutase